MLPLLFCATFIASRSCPVGVRKVLFTLVYQVAKKKKKHQKKQVTLSTIYWTGV